jgi:uncharacterized protein
MKILVIGDPHGKLPRNLDSIIKKNKIGVIICIGEVFPIQRGKSKGKVDLKTGEKVLDKICSYNIPIIIFKGNMFLSKQGARYFKELLIKYKKKYKNLNYKRLGKLKIEGINFIIFDMIYEKHSHTYLPSYFTDEEKNKKRLRKLNKLLKENKDVILLSHAPPYGYLDKIHSGKHIGSKFLLEAVKKNYPKLVLCGHIHEAKGKAKIGKTIVYNLGSEGDYAVIDTNKNKILESNFLKC